MFNYFLIATILFFASFPAYSQQNKTHWVDSIFQHMTLEEKIGQLFMIPVAAPLNSAELEHYKSWIHQYQPGSILVTRGGINSHTQMLNQLQALSPIPLAAGLAAEWGAGQTLDSAFQFHKPLLQGALQNDSLVLHLGKAVGKQLKALGIQINFAPNADLDILTEPYPYSLQFYGQNKKRVTAKNLAFVKGLKEEGVLACAKFTSDSHQEDSTITDMEFLALNQIDSLALYPLGELIRSGVGAILTTNLHFSTLEKKKRVPAAVSQLFITEILKNSLRFNGLVICDVNHLGRLAQKTRDGEAAKLAFITGHDILIASENIGESIRALKKIIRKNSKLENQLTVSVKKILAFKYESGLAYTKMVDTDNLSLKVNTTAAALLKQKVAEEAVTILRNENNLLPFRHLENKNFVAISIGREKENEFHHYLSRYAPIEQMAIRSLADSVVLKKIGKDKTVIIGLFPNASNLILALAPKLSALAATNDVIISSFGDQHFLTCFENIATITTSYAEEDGMPKATAQVLFGAIEGKGILPFTISYSFQEGSSIRTPSLHRFKYSVPEEAGMDSKTLAHISDIVREAIDIKAFPGCQIIIAKNGKVVYDKSLGWLTYDNQAPVTDSTIYDLASITKVAATLQSVMFLKDRGLVDIDKKAAVYLPALASTNKKDLTLKDILTHQSGLVPFIHMWPETVKDKKWIPSYYQTERSEKYPLQVAPKLFASPALRDSAWHWTLQSKMADRTPRTPYTYRYSDLGSIILHKLSEAKLNQPMEDFLHQNLYGPLGAGTLGYLPLDRFPSSQIAPTENDTIFRKQWIVGTVHDERAALFGGVAGHAGLFGNANDLAKLGQMLLNGGTYGGDQYYKPETIELFISKQYDDSRRGLGWDKPTPSDWNGPTALQASSRTFGHTGFTGTCIWVDPEFNLVFVLLSNRVYPYRSNNKISSANIRPRIQEVIYKSIFNYCQNQN